MNFRGFVLQYLDIRLRNDLIGKDTAPSFDEMISLPTLSVRRGLGTRLWVDSVKSGAERKGHLRGGVGIEEQVVEGLFPFYI